VISGFRNDVDKICARLAYYENIPRVRAILASWWWR